MLVAIITWKKQKQKLAIFSSYINGQNKWKLKGHPQERGVGKLLRRSSIHLISWRIAPWYTSIGRLLTLHLHFLLFPQGFLRFNFQKASFSSLLYPLKFTLSLGFCELAHKLGKSVPCPLLLNKSYPYFLAFLFIFFIGVVVNLNSTLSSVISQNTLSLTLLISLQLQ